MLETHRRLYNSCLDERKKRYKEQKQTVTYADQCKKYTADRKRNDFYSRIVSSSAQATMRRLDKSFSDFYRRIKLGENPGYPRFLSKTKHNSIEFPVYGDGICFVRNKLRVKNIGLIRAKLHRDIQGVAKTARLKFEGEKWYIIISCDLGNLAIPPSNNPPVGVDVGIKVFLAKSDGSKPEENPRYLDKYLPKIRQKTRSVFKKHKGGKNRKKSARELARLHARIRNLRSDHHHQVASRLIRRYGFIAVENLNINSMLKNHRLTRAITDAAWGKFFLILKSKAESAGVSVVEVNPRGTSQECSGCGQIVPKSLSVRWHNCPHCGLSLDRDENAARNILARGLLARTGPVEPKTVNETVCSKKPPRFRGGVVTITHVDCSGFSRGEIVVAGVASKRTKNVISDRFRAHRVAAGFSQTELALRLGKNAAEISGIEAGSRNPKAVFLAEAARVLQCDIADFLPPAEGLKNLVLVGCPHPDIIVGRTRFDAESLASLGYPIGLSINRVDRLVADAVGRCGVSVRSDLAPAGPVPAESDGLGQQYRERIYHWADAYIGEGFTDTKRELFRRVVVNGENPLAVGNDLGLAPGTVKNSSVRQCLWECQRVYDPLIRGPLGMRVAARIIRELCADHTG